MTISKGLTLEKLSTNYLVSSSFSNVKFGQNFVRVLIIQALQLIKVI